MYRPIRLLHVVTSPSATKNMCLHLEDAEVRTNVSPLDQHEREINIEIVMKHCGYQVELVLQRMRN